MRYFIEHQTSIDFPAPVNEHQCEMRFTPRSDDFQTVRKIDIKVNPSPEVFAYTDSFGNRVHYFSVLEPHAQLTTNVSIEVETTLENPFNYQMMAPDSERGWYRDSLQYQPELWQYVLHKSAQTPKLSDILFGAEGPPEWDHQRPVQHSLLQAMDWVGSFLSYRTGSTATHASLSDVVKARSGVCQDFAHLMIAIARSWGLPSRYVMGYLAPGYSDRQSLDGQSSHAWAEVLVPGAGWRGFDATHQLVANDTYIAVAVGRDSHDAAPQRGSFKGAPSERTPRVTLSVVQQGQ